MRGRAASPGSRGGLESVGSAEAAENGFERSPVAVDRRKDGRDLLGIASVAEQVEQFLADELERAPRTRAFEKTDGASGRGQRRQGSRTASARGGRAPYSTRGAERGGRRRRQFRRAAFASAARSSAVRCSDANAARPVRTAATRRPRPVRRAPRAGSTRPRSDPRSRTRTRARRATRRAHPAAARTRGAAGGRGPRDRDARARRGRRRRARRARRRDRPGRAGRTRARRVR